MRGFAALVGVLFLLMVPSLAFGQVNSTCEQYHPQICSSVSGSNATTPTSPSSSADSAATSSGTLPFTGLDVVLLVAGGAALLTGGFVVRRVSRRLN